MARSLFLISWLVLGATVGCSSDAGSNGGPSFKQRVLPEAVGDIAVGREIFYRKQAPKCWVCHAVGEEQERAGPNLQDVGAGYSRGELLDALLNPTREIAEGYAAEIVETRSRGLVVGVVARETPSLLIRNEMGDEIELLPGDVVSRRESELSMMPDDLADRLSDQELVDLLAFLGSLRD